MKKNSSQLCDTCKRRSSCPDFADNMKMRADGGLLINIIECDMFIPERAFVDAASSSATEKA